MAVVAYVKSGAGAAAFVQSNAYTAGTHKMVPKISDAGTNFAVARKWVWDCTTSGTSAAAEPTWPAAVTQDVTTVTSDTAVFTARKPGFSSGTTENWAYATIYILYGEACTAAAGDIVYTSNNHNETSGVAYSSTLVAGAMNICVDDGAAPPTTLAVTAALTTNAASISMTLSGTGSHRYGFVFTSGSGQSTTCNITATTSFENCQFILASTGASSQILNGAGKWLNCDVKFAASGHNISAATAMEWTGGSLLSGGTSPSALFGNNNIARTVVTGIDLSNAGTAINLCNANSSGMNPVFRDIKLPSSWSGAPNSINPADIGAIFDVNNGDSAGTNYVIQRKMATGLLTSEKTVVRTGGASDGATPLSWKVATTANASYPSRPFIVPETVVWNAATGSSITVVVECITDNVTLKDDQIWLEVIYLSETGSPRSALATSRRGLVTAAANVTTSTATWTTTGLGTPVKQKMSVSFTPNLKGFLHATVKVAKASTTVYVDPVLTIAGFTSAAQYQIPGGAYLNAPAAGGGGVPMSRVFTGM